jgi:hypothetical protein
MRLSGTVCASLLIFSATAMCVPQSIAGPPPISQTFAPKKRLKTPRKPSSDWETLLVHLKCSTECGRNRNPTRYPFSHQTRLSSTSFAPLTTAPSNKPSWRLIGNGWVSTERITIFYFSLDPGQHYFCSDSSSNRSVLKLAIVAGKTYYLQQTISAIRTDLRVLNEQEGKKGLAKCKPSGFEDKNSVPRP